MREDIREIENPLFNLESQRKREQRKWKNRYYVNNNKTPPKLRMTIRKAFPIAE